MSKPPLKICVVTGSRAEYGLLLPLMKALQKDRSTQLQIVVSGMHLSPEFGLTWRQIEADGFAIDKKVDMLLSGDTDVAISKSTGLGLIGMADAYAALKPDWVVLLGDRFEAFAAAIAAHLAKIPVAHLHGGELTEGATDDAFRHAITKLAYLHFTSTETYRRRVIQLGEEPERVFTVGALGLDTVKQVKLLSKKQLEAALGIKFAAQTFFITYHPVTLEWGTASVQMQNLLEALDQFPEATLIFSYPNADAGGRVIIRLIDEYVQKNADRSRAFASLGSVKYLSALQHVTAVIGNSSSGIIEAPFFKVPTINIGDRQNGRIKPVSVIDTATDTKSIKAGILKAHTKAFIEKCNDMQQPYGNGTAVPVIIREIKKCGRRDSIKKPFYDLPQ